MSWVLFFDGECGFCSSSVRRIFRLDRQGRIDFAPLQGELSKSKGFSHHAAADGGTVVLLRENDGKVFTESDALIEIARALGGAWRIFALAAWIPKGLRDMVYHWIARNRYRLMGKADQCSLPEPALAKRLRS